MILWEIKSGHQQYLIGRRWQGVRLLQKSHLARKGGHGWPRMHLVAQDALICPPPRRATHHLAHGSLAHWACPRPQCCCSFRLLSPPRDLNLLAFTTSPPLYNLLLRGFVTTQPHLGCSRNFLLYGPFDWGAEDFSGWVLSWAGRHRFNPVTSFLLNYTWHSMLSKWFQVWEDRHSLLFHVRIPNRYYPYPARGLLLRPYQ